MANSVAWKHFSRSQISSLEAALEHEQCKTLLSMYLGLGGFNEDKVSEGKGRLTKEEEIVLNFHYYNYAFCKERRFDACATSTFLSIMKDIFDEDMSTDDATSSLQASFARFEGLILCHSVDRPPWTAGTLSPKDVGAITDYVTTSYYRHYHLYKQVFTTKINLIFEQRHPHNVEEPCVPPALDRGLML